MDEAAAGMAASSIFSAPIILPGRVVQNRGLLNKEPRSTPLVHQDDSRQYQAAQQIASQHVTSPVLPQIDARCTNQEYESAKQSQ